MIQNALCLMAKTKARSYLHSMLQDYQDLETDSIEKLLDICGDYFSPSIDFDLRRETQIAQFSLDELQALTFDFAQQQELKWKEFDNTFKGRYFRCQVVSVSSKPPKYHHN